MYTRCPQCGTIFRISFEQLRAEQGKVRCGICAATFSALESLSDQYDPNEAAENDDTNEQPLIKMGQDDPELRVVAEDTPEMDLVDSDVPELEPEPEEYSVPQESWESFFEPVADTDNRQDEALTENLPEDTEESFEDFSPDVAAEPSGDKLIDKLLDEETSNVDEWRSFLDEFETDTDDNERPIFIVAAEDDYSTTASPEANENEDYSDSDESIPDEYLSALPQEEACQHDEENIEVVLAEEPFEDDWVDYGGTTADNTADSDQPAHFTEDEPDDESTPAPWDRAEPGSAATFNHSGTSWKKIAAAVILAAALLIQLVHYNRDSLAAHATYGSTVRDIYELFSANLYPEWNLDDYAIRNQEAIGSLASQRALNILANIEVIGQQPVAPPLVRVRLLDRWGKPVGSRVFGPAEYRTDNNQPTGMLKTGMTIPVLVRVLDPGIEAQGYEIDLCLPSRKVRLRCQKDSNPFQP